MLVSCDYAFLILCGAGGIPYSHTGEPLSVHSKDVDYDYLHWFFFGLLFVCFFLLLLQLKHPNKSTIQRFAHPIYFTAQLFNYLIFLKGFLVNRSSEFN